jgi:hypothetical protein
MPYLIRLLPYTDRSVQPGKSPVFDRTADQIHLIHCPNDPVILFLCINRKYFCTDVLNLRPGVEVAMIQMNDNINYA